MFVHNTNFIRESKCGIEIRMAGWYLAVPRLMTQVAATLLAVFETLGWAILRWSVSTSWRRYA